MGKSSIRGTQLCIVHYELCIALRPLSFVLRPLSFVLRPLSFVLCPLSSPLLGTKKCTESGALRITKNSSAKLQKVVEIAKFFAKKISTNFRFGKLFWRVRKLKY